MQAIAHPLHTRDQPQLPPSTIGSSAAPSPHASEHVESDEHDTEHEPVHVIAHVEPSLHVTLPLGPTVIVHVEPPLQSRLHDSPQLPVHSLSSVQSSEQLSPSHALPDVSQAVPGSQVQLLPVQLGGGALSEPHAASASEVVRTSVEMSLVMAWSFCTTHAVAPRSGWYAARIHVES